jgi:hypothetical protein
MTRKKIEVVSCNGCFVEVPMAPTRFWATLPDGWGHLHTDSGADGWDLCPRCVAAIARSLFATERVDVTIANRDGPPDEQRVHRETRDGK